MDPPTFQDREFLINRLFGAITGFLGTVGVFFYRKLTIFSKFLAGNSRRFHGFHGRFFQHFPKTIKFFPGNSRVFPRNTGATSSKIDKNRQKNRLYNSKKLTKVVEKNHQNFKKNPIFWNFKKPTFFEVFSTFFGSEKKNFLGGINSIK
jgi:hypothetical protein